MTPSGTATATCCSVRSPSASARRSAPTARSPGSVGTSSRSSARGAGPTTRSSWPPRLGEVLGAAFEVDGVVLDVQASIGVALFPDHGSSVETLLQKADVAMYRAKETRQGLALYEERHDHNSPAKLALTAELRNAVDTDEILIHYQPELDLRTGEVNAVEALVRWDHPGAGVLAPSSFVRLAEQANLIKPLTHRVIELALAQVARLAPPGSRPHRGGQHLTPGPRRPQLHRSCRRRAARCRRPPGRLKLEVTESTLMADPFAARAVLRELEGLGVEISIDDFGTGYSSLAYLADLPVSEVKIDRSFVSRMAHRVRRADHRQLDHRPRSPSGPARGRRRGRRPLAAAPAQPSRLRRRPGLRDQPAPAGRGLLSLAD